MSAPVRVRFAPSPTGPLHAGSARTALLNWLFARSRDGDVLLRIDDTDRERSRVELEQPIFDDLEWLGIDWDSGPVRQSERTELYAAALERLPTVDRDGAFEFEGRVIARADGSALYHLATAVDEIDDGITHVLRGRDHLENTRLQAAIIKALGAQPPEYVHVPLMTFPGGGKLSKRETDGTLDATIAALRKDGIPPAAVANAMAISLADYGTDEVMLTLDEMAQRFSLDNIHTADSQFDVDKLLWLSGQHIRAMSDDELASRLAEFAPVQRSSAVLEAARTGGTTLRECAQVAIDLIDPPDPDEQGRELAATDEARAAARLLCELSPQPPASLGDAERLFDALKARLREDGIKLGPALRGLRAALTGRDHGPEMPYVLATVSVERLRRLCGLG
ncbi:MAG TPA: glutamate--tRNA ligase family protein [Solirubrobacterales bacterium]|jgi:glutamyl-tRNA synthetase|nr:glutamate--tRNA ligase family protein [Solirubrobacterales bacterium]